ncbi:hypothetical protein H310_13069 [Aphanomyces invadans]|uniref:Uncharacterized protein n=1 Tax=Aphanomyces invadans TaxID=157072 RepID=A0A024TEM3_9STRA|nr:hypothetical protein H310_13069 [Aphanomyces invadans]ETV92615.1 hypothetical protein H310_13069 [Aphanomyces invadans]|eukprot:XP_008878651.1 hypothetical protein H310_13069 [Aphanomyces invadans]
MRSSLAAHKRAFRKNHASSNVEVIESASSKAPFRQARKSGVLTLPAKGLTTFPDEALRLMDFLQPDEKGWECVDLIKVDLSHNEIASIPADIQGLSGLLSFKICQNKLVEVPLELFSLTSLVYLDLSNNCLRGPFPDPLGRLNNLKELVLSGNKLTTLPPSMGDLTKLEVLRLEDNSLTGFPDSFGGLQKLQTLTAQNNNIDRIPLSFKDLRQIATLDLSKNQITSLIGCLKNNERLKFLDLRQNRLGTFPELPYECTLDTLFLGFNQLTTINAESLVRAKDHLTILDIRDNKLAVLPDDICQLHRLKTLDVSNNDLSDLPPGLGYLVHLHHILTDGNSMRAIRRTVLSSGCEPLKKYLRTRGKPPAGVNALDEEFDEFQQEPVVTDVELGYVLRDASASGTLELSDKKFSKVPLDFWRRDPMVEKLQVLDLSKNGLALVLFDVATCVNLHTLVLDDNVLESVPESIRQLAHLHTLRLRKNNLVESTVDPILGPGTPLSFRLKELDLRNNSLRCVPSGIANLSALQTLLLSFNQISTLDNVDWSRLVNLFQLSVADNKLVSLGNLYHLPKLTSLSIENNSLTQIPGELGLMKLKTLAMNGNPQRTVRMATLNKGIDDLLLFLRNKLTPAEIEAFSAPHAISEPSPTKIPTKSSPPLVKPPAPSCVVDAPPPRPAEAPEVTQPAQPRGTDDKGQGTSAIDARIATLSEQLEDHGLSAAKRYALKKDLAKARAEKIRESRKGIS